MVKDIPRAVMTLLYKNMHLTTENELEFASETTKLSFSEESMMQQMMGLMQHTQHLLVSQNQLLARPPRPPTYRAIDSSPPFIAAMYEDQSISAMTENVPDVSGSNRRKSPDPYTQEGLRDMLRLMAYNYVYQMVEVTVANSRMVNNKNSGNGNGTQQRESGKCYLCDDPNHRVSNRPLRQTVMQLVANGAVGTKPVQGQVPAQR
ncbi:hypothetical protein PHMEG_00010133 [Phytophthora megakarya]|uniref:Uncharacterized protein n=1 Tax=Phytophthora megakarya TaxID=4795 RepID=A0A225WEG9_9STRA|nr:hypothetical protein PHMEG_00010133 [Phytophthora megakarya]